MNFHDAVLDGFALDAQRVLTVRFSEVKGEPAGDIVVLTVTGHELLLQQGQFEADWFLSTVFCVDNAGARQELHPGARLKVGRLVVLGDNGAFLEVVGGQLEVEVSRGR